MLGVSCSPFSIAALLITPFSALGIWHAVHPGKCQQYGICYTYWSWYTVENNGPNFKRHGAKNRACCSMQTVNPPWMSCLKTKRSCIFHGFPCLGLYFGVTVDAEYCGRVSPGWSLRGDSGSARRGAEAGWVRVCAGGSCRTCLPGAAVPRASSLDGGCPDAFPGVVRGSR